MSDEDPFSSEESAAPAAQGDPFGSPPSSETMKAFVGKLVLIKVLSYDTGIQTKFGEKDGVSIDIVVLDAKGGGKLTENVSVLQGVMVGKLKKNVGGRMVLGKIFKRPTDKGNDAYDISQPTEDDKALARKYLANV